MKSMTGFGRAVGLVAGMEITVELRSLNHRYRDLRLQVPRNWLALEVPVEAFIRQRIERGRIECVVRFGKGETQGEPHLDMTRARQYLQIYQKVASEVGVSRPPDLAWLLAAEGVVSIQDLPEDIGQAQVDLEKLVGAAFNALDRMREAEGAKLHADLLNRLTRLDDLAVELRQALPAESQALADRTSERIRLLAGEANVAEERLAVELAILAERTDVTEELVRFQSHREQFATLLDQSGAVGREIDFLLQELNREVNTLSAKIRSAPLVRLAVALKSELEKMREQVQNVE
jgi:uncharacterized protein (TIGR00255 family)